MYLFIHRKDLRTDDLRAFEALHRRGGADIHLLVIDPAIAAPDRLQTHSGRTFLRAVTRLAADYRQAGRTLHLLHGDPVEITEALLLAMPIAGLVQQADFTPYAVQRDTAVEAICKKHDRGYKTYDDAPLIDLADFGQFARRTEPYKVFTPFYKMWSGYMRQCYAPSGSIRIDDLATVDELESEIETRFRLPAWIDELLVDAAAQEADEPSPQEQLTDFIEGPIADYSRHRDDFAVDAGSGLARWINHGALSPRRIYEAVAELEEAHSWIRQLAWRDFYLMQARQNPDFFTYERQFDFRELSEHHYEAWIHAQTGIPIIDAAMTQLRETGELPNRLRMVTAMFLTKNLRCPFTKGEQYFRRMLADYDHTLNRGGWLWSSSLGYDAAPYFRIMNPVTQSMTHNPSGSYIRKWLPELAHLPDKIIHQPRPEAIVDLKQTRAHAIEVYGRMLRGYEQESASPGTDEPV
ncbi:deoxyribodipyrimidine photo-lyase [Paenibacillus phyllosphaerae]|uniref:Deoxyribodipyrimidine photo-lyase n=1 Tax=Paenibacillus phyllosphaerae TaxID=274593 RepID=A0A7W5B417_9BACL|nr:deoxyribodipyrimidine photo-lyase [Paenibacillus phyllosphaerae]MBB3113852.1 deoxyribodipyrimidine photo-lyase [Paenibacillus phyllosphaerae]